MKTIYMYMDMDMYVSVRVVGETPLHRRVDGTSDRCHPIAVRVRSTKQPEGSRQLIRLRPCGTTNLWRRVR